MKHALFETKLGWAAIGIEDGKICASILPRSREDAQRAIIAWGAGEPADDAEAAPLIDLYRRAAEGEAVEVDGNLKLVHGTTFQRAVWQAMASIPHGSVISYAELARRAGYAGAARAVGQALGRNPIPLLLPCQRVVAADGSIGGFGSGLPMKRTLLGLEGVAV